jgi:hypothetical protein
MYNKNKLDSESDFSFLGKKRNNEIEYKKNNNNKNSENNYEYISNIYKNIFGFDWTDSLFKEGEKILENITPDAVIILYNTLYFKQDLFYLNLMNKSYFLNSFFDPFDYKSPDAICIKKSAIIPEKVNFIFKMIELFNYFTKKELNSYNNTKEEEFNKFNNFLFQKYQHIKNINRLRIAKLIEKINIWQQNKKLNEQDINSNIKNNQYILNISQTNLLKDNQIPNSNNISKKILNNFCYNLHKMEMETITQKKNSEKIFESYLEINRLKNDENWTCFVCNNGLLEGNDIFYECEKCKISVHQNCYGILTNNIENWLCDACLCMSKDEAQNLECILCPVKGGAMKKVNLPKNCKFIQNLEKIRKNEFDLEKNKYNSICIIPKLNNNILNAERAWVHLSCALWNPDIEIKEINGNTNIKFIDDISYNKFMEKCDVCGKKGYGPTIKCNNDNCNFRCHPECGRINGYRLEIENKTKNGFLNFNMYCFIHQPVKLGKIFVKFYKNKEQKIEEFANFLKRTYKNYEKEYQKKITDFDRPNKLIIKAS